MSTQLHLSRLTLRHTPEIAPLINVLQPAARAERNETDHRLIWSAMPEEVQRKYGQSSSAHAPFLWRRDEGRGRYYVLGPEPSRHSNLFDVESKPFEVNLSPGDRLQFVLRVNATVDRRSGGRDGKRERSDVAMDLLHAVGKSERAGRRQEIAARAAKEWLAARSKTGGFSLEALHLDGYRAVVIRRNPKKPGRIGVFDLRGLLTVTDPTAFVARISGGFGRAKAFGCGLMLIRRAE